MSLVPTSHDAAAALLSLVCGFIIKITVAYGVCWFVARILTSPAARFLVWLVFLFSSATYWLFSIARLFTPSNSGPSSSTGGASSSHAIWLPSHAGQLLAQVLEAATGLYAAALLAMLLLGCWKRLQLTRALRFRQEPAPPVRKVFEELATATRAPSCKLWLLPGLTSPAELGWLRPTIYLPADDAVEPANLGEVLLHELSHVKRRDALWDASARFCRWIVLFHPCMHRAFTALRLERELACDLVVIRRDPARRDSYADTLVRFAWRSSVAQIPDRIGIGFTSNAAVLNTRIRSILRGERACSRWSLGTQWLLCTGAFWVFAVTAPALWVGFHLAFAPLPSKHANLRMQPMRHVRRHAHLASMPVRVERSGMTVDIPVSSRDPLALMPFETPTVTFQSSRKESLQEVARQSAEQQDAEPSATQSGGGGPVPAPGVKLPSVPSMTSTIVNAVAAISRIRLGHDHDHD